MLIDIAIKDTGAVAKNFEECSLKTTLSNEKIYRGQSAISEPRERGKVQVFFLRILERARPFQTIPPLVSLLPSETGRDSLR